MGLLISEFNDIEQISLGLRHTGAQLTEIKLTGRHIAIEVSKASIRCLCDVIRHQATRLERVFLWRLYIEDESLVRLVEKCTAVKTMREIT